MSKRNFASAPVARKGRLSKRGPGLAATLFLILGALSLGGAAFSPGNIADVGSAGVEVSFTQLDWLDEAGQPAIPFSRVGSAELSFSDAAQQLLADQGGAFININTSLDGGITSEWSVRNLHLSYSDPEHLLASSPSVHFALAVPNGVPVGDLAYHLSVSPEPLEEPATGAFQWTVVEHAGYHTGGFEGGGSGLASTPFTIGPWIGPDFFSGALERTSSTLLAGDALPAVDEDVNGCAPGSVARSIKYMLDAKGLPGDDVQDIYDDLYGDMGTTEEGTTVGGMVGGKQQYAEDNGLPIDTNLTGWTGDLSEVMDALDNCGDVEILIGWDDGGGHAAMVTDIQCLDNGQYQITYVDDPHQGDGVAENEEHVITVNPDGSFDGGTVLGFLVEHINA